MDAHSSTTRAEPQTRLGPPARPEVLALFGPTAVGKTAIAIALAELLRSRGEHPVAVSADALQVYRGLELLTGVPSPAERAALEHRLISFLPLDATFSAGQYAALAHAEIDGLLAAGRRPLVVGGTGLYLRAALGELDLRPPPAEGARERWSAELRARGAVALHGLLERRAAWAAREIDPHDAQRLVRALELLDAGELEPPEGPSQLWSGELRHPTLLVGLVMERQALHARIDARVREMLAECLARRVRGARGGRLGHGAQGTRFRGAARRRRRAHAPPYSQLRPPPADVDAQARRAAPDRRKWPRSRLGGARDPRRLGLDSGPRW